MKAAIYLRVSTADQTTANQLDECVSLARAKGLPFEVFQEVGSAAKARPVLERVLARAHAREFTHLVVWAIDRFGRSMAKNLDELTELDRAGVRVLSVREAWMDQDGPARSLLIAVMSWVAEQERARLSERTKAGMERARAAGKHVGRPRKVAG
jgi:DNA invertase Pin-like site-specific DNA recombinase